MDDQHLTPEALIAGMTPDEICELLAEMDIDASVDEARLIQQMIREVGSLDEVLDVLENGLDGLREAA